MNIQQTYLQQLQKLEVNPSQIGSFIGDLRHSIPEVVDIPPIRQLLNQGQKKGLLEGLITILIIKAANRLSVGNNLKPTQAEEIASNIINDYPLLSIDDINILLSNGTKGKYGEIYRFDISVIYSWIRSYEEEKAEYVEVKHKTESKKEVEYPKLSNDTEGQIEAFLNRLAEAEGLRKVTQLSRKEIKDAEKPADKVAKSKGVKYGSEYYNWLLDMKFKYAKECTDMYTGRVKTGQPTFDEWIKIMTDVHDQGK